MITCTLQYFEIMDEDFTGVEAIIKAGDQVEAVYRNFEKEENDGEETTVWANQEEIFEFPSIEIAKSIFEKNPEYGNIK